MSSRHQLTRSSPSETEVVFTREFDGPRPLVWDALTKPELLRTWLTGPPGWEMTRCDDDTRPGGKFLLEWRGKTEGDLSIDGVYQEVSPPARIVRTEAMTLGGLRQPGEQLATLELDDLGAVTRLTLRLEYKSREARDGVLDAGMEQGMAASYDRLDDLLAERLAAHG